LWSRGGGRLWRSIAGSRLLWSRILPRLLHWWRSCTGTGTRSASRRLDSRRMGGRSRRRRSPRLMMSSPAPSSSRPAALGIAWWLFPVAAPEELTLDFNPLHTLGFLGTEWVEHHCKVPGGVFEGEPLVFNGWQLYCTANHYRIRPDAVPNARRLVAPFHYRRSVVVGPQKCGKSPWAAGLILFEGLGPSTFAGWASEGDVYRCADHECGCDFEYEYLPGEAMGEPRRKSLIALMAVAEDQVFNVYEPIQTMILSGPLANVAKVREGFIRLPNRGLITP